jgi:hypothetical protein
MSDSHAGKHSHGKGRHREGSTHQEVSANEKAYQMEKLAKHEDAKLLESFLNKTDQKLLRKMETEIKRGDLQQEHLPLAQFIRDKKTKEITQIVFDSPWKDDSWASQSYCRDPISKHWRNIPELHRDKAVPNPFEEIGKGAMMLKNFFIGEGNPFTNKNPEKGPAMAKQLWQMSKEASNPQGK